MNTHLKVHHALTLLHDLEAPVFDADVCVYVGCLEVRVAVPHEGDLDGVGDPAELVHGAAEAAEDRLEIEVETTHVIGLDQAHETAMKALATRADAPTSAS